jgi:CSLREA domain-containing protein
MFTKKIKKLFLLIAVFSALVGGALTPLQAQAAVFNVTKTTDTNDGVCNTDCSLREAIVAANALTGPHTINVPAGTYTLTIAGAGEEDTATGDLDISEDITITGAGAATTIINGGGIDRVFDIDPYDNSPTVTLQNLTITGGNEPLGDGGGGILNNWQGCAVVTLTNVVITANMASAGAGGGVASQGCGSLTITNSTISGNVSGNGGGIYADAGIITITGSTISGNTVSISGGGIYASNVITTITGSTISGNAASNYGGGIYINSSTTITSSTISNNTASSGGGVSFGEFFVSGDLQILNSTISGNNATNFGGGIFNANYGSLTPLLLSYSTIANNNAATGGGIYGDFILDSQLNPIPSNTAFGNTIVANNPTGGNCAGAGTRTSNGNNLDSANTCGFAGAGDLVNTNPILSALANNGGSTFTHALLTGSPAINAGNNTGCPATDQRGYYRSGNCDIGAYEFGGAGGSTPPTPSGSGESGGGGCGSGSSGGSNCSGDNSSSVCSQMSNKKNNQQPFSGALMLLAPLTWLLFRRAVRKILNAQALQVSRP